MEQPAPLRARWTPAKQRIFLAALVETGSIARPAKAAGMARSSAHRLRTKLKGTTFDDLWDYAVTEHDRLLADPLTPDVAGGHMATKASPAKAGAQSRAAS